MTKIEGFHPFIELTKHFTARVENSHATPVQTSYIKNFSFLIVLFKIW